MDDFGNVFERKTKFFYIPLYTSSDDEIKQLKAEIKELKTMRGNSVLVPADKLKEMQDQMQEMKVLLTQKVQK